MFRWWWFESLSQAAVENTSEICLRFHFRFLKCMTGESACTSTHDVSRWTLLNMIDGDVEFEFVISYSILIHWKTHPYLHFYKTHIYSIHIQNYTHNSLQFPAEKMNTSSSKTPTTLNLIHTHYDYRGRLSVNSFSTIDLTFCHLWHNTSLPLMEFSINPCFQYYMVGGAITLLLKWYRISGSKYSHTSKLTRSSNIQQHINQICITLLNQMSDGLCKRWVCWWAWFTSSMIWSPFWIRSGSLTKIWFS